jgi:hypothetical protein
MSALVAGFFLIGYLLAPGVLYRLAFSAYIPAKRYQRTRTEEIVFSLLVTVLPFLLAWIVLLHTPLGALPHFAAAGSKHEAYRTIFRSLLPGADLSKDLEAPAYTRGFLEQARFLGVLWPLCAIEGWLCGRIVARYGDYKADSWRKWFCDRVLLTYVSEWEILFTALALPTSQADVEIEIDALAADVLYRGKLVDWFLDTDGKLEGIFLENAARYQKDDLARDRDHNITQPKESYWRAIPGAKLYLVASTIANYNIRYTRPPSATQVNTIAQLRARLGDDTIITALPPERFEVDPPSSLHQKETTTDRADDTDKSSD